MQTVAIVGATGAVGQEILHLLAERQFPLRSLKVFASERSRGKTIRFKNDEIPIETLTTLKGIDLAFFCAGSSLSKEWREKADCLVIDSSSAFRMKSDVPLVIPEINPHTMKGQWIASPNCIATILLMSLFPLHRKYQAKRIVLATYQAASGGGARLMQELEEETRAHLEKRPYRHQLAVPYAFNLFPHLSPLDASGYVEEEIKIGDETRKILEDDAIQISATCVRVPVLRAHSIAVNVEFRNPFSLEEIPECFKNVSGVKIFENRSENRFATPFDVSGKDEVFCGRFRIDPSQPNTLEFWAVGDQLRKGAALNAVQIAEHYVAKKNIS